MSFEYKNSDSSYEMWALAHSEAPQNKTGRFLTLSAAFHIALFTGAAMLSTPLVEAIKTETITIEIAEPVRQVSRGAMIPATEGRKIEQMADSTPIAKDDIVIPVAKALPKASAVKTAKMKLATRSHSARPAVAPKAMPTAQKAEVTAAPKLATIDDIDAPEIDQSALEADHATTAAALNDTFADEDLEQIDHKQAKMLLEEKGKLDQEADSVDAEAESTLADIDQASKAEAAALAEANRSRRAQEAQAIAAAAQGEREAQAAAARKAAAAAAQKAANGKEGQGAGARGSKQASATAAGSADGVRSLDQLRQMPGNRGPQYSSDERLKGERGVVSFVAYVTKEGRLSQFKQISSTGHKNLDSKTLAALQRWRFYPGQEGWVELPIQWDLRGEPQALGGLLRVSRN